LADFENIEDLDDARRPQLLVESVSDYAIYLLSIDGRVLSWNSGAERLKGYHAEEIIGRPFSDFYTPEDRTWGSSKVRGNQMAARRVLLRERQIGEKSCVEHF
jgi:PAS domain S-box-containing protein